jgi:hypothetical protein
MAISVARNGALEFSEEAGRCTGILRSSFDKNLFLLSATGFQYAAEIFRRCGLGKQ